MLDETQARQVIDKAFPNAEVTGPFDYRGIWLFRVYRDDPDEGLYDPFFSVNQSTGELLDFSIMTDGDIDEITELFENA